MGVAFYGGAGVERLFECVQFGLEVVAFRLHKSREEDTKTWHQGIEDQSMLLIRFAINRSCHTFLSYSRRVQRYAWLHGKYNFGDCSIYVILVNLRYKNVWNSYLVADYGYTNTSVLIEIRAFWYCSFLSSDIVIPVKKSSRPVLVPWLITLCIWIDVRFQSSIKSRASFSVRKRLWHECGYLVMLGSAPLLLIHLNRASLLLFW